MKKWVTRSGYVLYQVLNRRCNCFLLSNGSNCILIDTSIRSEWKLLHKRILDICRTDNILRAVILTHTHFDHASNTADVKETFHAQVIVHKEEARFLRQGNNQLPRGTNIFGKTLYHFFNSRELAFMRFRPVEEDIRFEDTYSLSNYGFNAYIIHTPGHSSGSSSVIIDNEIAIVGDAMVGFFKGIIFPPFADDPETLKESWEKLRDSGCRLYLPAHGHGNDRDTVLKNLKG